MLSTPVILALGALVVVGCKEAQRPPDAPADAPPPPAPPPPTPDPIPAPAPTPSSSASAPNKPTKSPTSNLAPIGATGKRSQNAASVIGRCKEPLPNTCNADADCAILDISTWDGPCASTLRAGITASELSRYSGGHLCDQKGPANPPLCVVHWVRAEDGPVNPPGGGSAKIDVRCIKTGAGKGACTTQYFAEGM